MHYRPTRAIRRMRMRPCVSWGSAATPMWCWANGASNRQCGPTSTRGTSNWEYRSARHARGARMAGAGAHARLLTCVCVCRVYLCVVLVHCAWRAHVLGRRWSRSGVHYHCAVPLLVDQAGLGVHRARAAGLVHHLCRHENGQHNQHTRTRTTRAGAGGRHSLTTRYGCVAVCVCCSRMLALPTSVRVWC